MARVEIIGKPGCHLCDEARLVVMAVCAELGESFREVSILEHPELADEYWTEIPVVTVDGQKIAFWRVTREQLVRALTRGSTVSP